MAVIIVISDPPKPPPPPPPNENRVVTASVPCGPTDIAKRAHAYSAALRALNDAFDKGCSFRVLDDV